jgi:hypothetical protein
MIKIVTYQVGTFLIKEMIEYFFNKNSNKINLNINFNFGQENKKDLDVDEFELVNNEKNNKP